MWPFKRHISLKESGIFKGFTDWHSHILPGVDDGIQTMEEVLEILQLYEELEIKSVWLTPHIMEDISNTTTYLRERFTELQATYTGSVELHLAAENMLDNLFEERLEKNDVLPLGENGDHLLVETSYFTPPMNLHGTLERIRAKGYYPVLAHPERYVYLDRYEYEELKTKDVKFQLNLFSLTGMYGYSVKKKAKALVNKKCYNFLGTDLHCMDVIRFVDHINLSPDILKINV